MDVAGDFPVLSMGEVHAGAIDMLDGGAGVFEGSGDEEEALLGLLGDVAVVCADWTGAGDVDVVAEADGSGEADDGLVGRCAGDIGAND